MKPTLYILPVAINQEGLVKLNDADQRLAQALYYCLLANPRVTIKMEVVFVADDANYTSYQQDQDPRRVVIEVLGDYPKIEHEDHLFDLMSARNTRVDGKDDKLLVLNPNFHQSQFDFSEPSESFCQLNPHNVSEIVMCIEPLPDDDGLEG